MPGFFMKILMSPGTRLVPLESVPAVMSSAAIVWRVESETMSGYCDEIFAAALVIF